MSKTDILSADNKAVGTIDLPQDIFGVKVKKGLLHDVVRNYLANQRQGSASTKTRGRVRGGGKKPYKQKGTGRARAGSTRSPLWRGGGTVFGPLQRDYSYRIPKKVKWAALSAALSAKCSDGEVIVVEDVTLSEAKTKHLASYLRGFSLDNVLIILPEENKTVKLAARNIPNVDVAVAGKLNIYKVLRHEKLMITRDALEKMKEVYL